MSSFDPKALGDRVRQMRLARSLTLKEIERTVGISATHVSEIERGKTSPTVRALEKIASALGVSISRLLESDANEPVHVARAGQLRSLTLDEGALTLRALSSGVPARRMSFFDLRVPSGGTVTPRVHRGVGEDVLVVLEGTIDVACGHERGTLGPGDSAHLRSRGSLTLINAGEREARALWVTTPRYGL